MTVYGAEGEWYLTVFDVSFLHTLIYVGNNVLKDVPQVSDSIGLGILKYSVSR